MVGLTLVRVKEALVEDPRVVIIIIHQWQKLLSEPLVVPDDLVSRLLVVSSICIEETKGKVVRVCVAKRKVDTVFQDPALEAIHEVTLWLTKLQA